MAVRWQIDRYDVVGSTMDLAADLALAGAPAGIVVVAEEQLAGRGRLGRIWLAPHGTCLLFTVLLRPPLGVAQRPDLSRVIAERVRDAVEEVTGLRAEIKEPNDLLVNGRKLCGILCQTSIRGGELEYLLVGIGLNVNLPANLLPLPTATSLLVETGATHERETLLAAILRHLEAVPGLTDGIPVDGPATATHERQPT